MTKLELEKLLRRAGFRNFSGGKHDIWIKKGHPPDSCASTSRRYTQRNIEKYFEISWFGETKMKHYYAIFKKTSEAIEVEFPDLKGCVTFGKTWEEALSNAEEVLAAWLAHAESKFIKTPSTHAQLTHLQGELVPIPIVENILASYQDRKRFNVIFPSAILKRIDTFRKKVGLKRSMFLQKAAEAYLLEHEHRV